MRVSPGAGWRGTPTTRSMFTLPTTVMVGPVGWSTAGTASGAASWSRSATLMDLLAVGHGERTCGAGAPRPSASSGCGGGATGYQLNGHDDPPSSALRIRDPLEEQAHRRRS